MPLVYAMRHGQSTWQTICPISPYATAGLPVPCTLCLEAPGRSTDLDHVLFDPPLSDVGIGQARAWATEVAQLAIDHSRITVPPCDSDWADCPTSCSEYETRR